jgi:hypothetical protein
MAVDKKISQLASGAPAQAGDEYVVARSGANYKLTLTNIAASMPPIGATTPNTGAFTTLSASSGETISGGNLTFSSTAQRITGDFSNATITNRVLFETSTANSTTEVGIIPSGSGGAAVLNIYPVSNPSDTGYLRLASLGTDSRILSQRTGTGTFLPLTFYAGGSERVRIDTSGNVGIGTASANKSSSSTALTVNTGTAGNFAAVEWASGDTLNYHINANNSAIYHVAAGTRPWIVFTNGSERMRIDSSGNVGIGTASPGAKLDLGTDVTAQKLFVFRSSNSKAGFGVQSGDFRSFAPSDAAMTFGQISVSDGTTYTERMRIDSSGNVGIGATADATTKFQVTGTYPTSGTVTRAILMNGTVPSGSTFGGYGIQSILNTQAASFTTANLVGFSAAQGTIGAGSTVTSQFGFIAESTLTGATNNYGFYSDIASGSNRWNFYAAGTALNYMAGGLGVKENIANWSTRSFAVSNTGAGNSTCLFINDDSGTATSVLWNKATSGNNKFEEFITDAGATLRGSIDYDRIGGLVRYNTTSDYRAKTIIGPVTNSGELVDALKVYVGKMNGATVERPMLIAHEAQEVAPYAVSGEKDAVDKDGKPVYQQIDVSSLVPLLLAEVKSLRQRVAELEAK